MDDPCIWMIAWESRENLCRLMVIFKCVFRIIDSPKVLVKVSVGNGVWDVVFPHFLLTDADGAGNVFLEGKSFALANQYLPLFLVDIGEYGATVHALNFDFGYFLEDA